MVCMQALGDRLKAASVAITRLLGADERTLHEVTHREWMDLLIMGARLVYDLGDQISDKVSPESLQLAVFYFGDRLECSHSAVSCECAQRYSRECVLQCA